jgi:hypothetical protein
MIIVDADTILYRVGFTHPPSSDAALRQLNVYMDTILNRVAYRYSIEKNNHILCLTETKETRYRDVFSKTVKYKEHRGKTAPPSWMEEMKEFCLDAYNTQYVPSDLAEADDAVAWHAYEKFYAGKEYYVVVGVDKDLKQIPGHHYNYVKDLFSFIHPFEANRFFFHQLLTGDVADNIPGIRGIGDARAKALLSKGKTPQQWWDIVLETYNNHYAGMDEDTLCDLLYERGNLLWIQRHEGQTWYPPIPEGD